MSWFKKLLGFKEKEQPEIQETQEEQIIEEDSREILKDRNGEDLICQLCENWDNEENKYYPIHQGEKQMFQGKAWHSKCLRAFKKEARKGNLI